MKKNTNESNLIRRSHGVRPTPSPKGRLYNREGNRRGFTIVELVVTLTIIVLVSAISIGVVAVNNKTYGETIDMIEATNIAENAVECFRFVVNNGDYKQVAFNEAFLNSFDATRKENIDISCHSHEEYQGESLISQTDTYTVSDDRIIVLIVIEISVERENVRNTITVSASSETDANLLEPITYTVR